MQIFALKNTENLSSKAVSRYDSLSFCMKSLMSQEKKEYLMSLGVVYILNF
jgi:hypothetical protein